MTSQPPLGFPLQRREKMTAVGACDHNLILSFPIRQ